MTSAASAPGGNRRLEQLYEISTLFNAFNSIEDTFDTALKIIAGTLPLESAILIEAVIGGKTDMVVWSAEGRDRERLAAAKTHAAAAYGYLVGSQASEPAELREDLGPSVLATPIRTEPGDSLRYIVLPLVVGKRAVFGALQFEAAAPLVRDDLEFVNAIANQLAVALERNRARTYDNIRRLEAQLSQAKYESLVDHLDYVFVWEAELETHRLSYVSAQVERMLGYSRRACLGDPGWWDTHVHPDDRDLLARMFDRAVAEPLDHRCEHRCLTADGVVRWLHTSVHLVAAAGETPRFQGVSFDITAARVAQEVIREQLSFTTAMASSLGEGALAIDREGRITFLNDAALRLLGCHEHDTIGRRCIEVFQVENADRAIIESPLELAIRTGGPVRSEDHVIVRADRSRFPASYTATPIVRDGRVTGAVVAFDDISERKHAQQADQFLLAAGLTLGASLESATVGNAVAGLGVSLLGHICFVSLVAADDRLLHVAAAHAEPGLQADLDARFRAGEVMPLFEQPASEVVETGRSVQVLAASVAGADLRVVEQLGICHVLIVPLGLGDRRLGTLTFCTSGEGAHGDAEVALAEELARRCAHALEHARLYEHARHAVALRDETLAIVSHDLRTPLATIVLACEMLDGEGMTPASGGAKVLSRIQSAASRMDRMIEDLLDFASIESGHLAIDTKAGDVAAIIEESAGTFESLAKKRQVKLTTEVPADMPPIECDRDRILQVIANLAGNALKIIAPGSSVSLSAKVRERDVVFAVSDTGPGISRANQAHLFDRFWRGPDAAYKGSGLGLAIARGIVEAHHGHIWIESELGRGSTFFFTVPLAAAAALPG